MWLNLGIQPYERGSNANIAPRRPNAGIAILFIFSRMDINPRTVPRQIGIQ